MFLESNATQHESRVAWPATNTAKLASEVRHAYFGALNCITTQLPNVAQGAIRCDDGEIAIFGQFVPQTITNVVVEKPNPHIVNLVL